MRVILSFSIAVLATQFLPADPPADKQKPDRELIEGTWEVSSQQEDGKPVESANVIRISFNKGKLNGTRDGEPAGKKGKYKIDPRKNPKWIDVTGNDMTVLGIYEFVDDDTLRMCHSNPGGKRPTKFVSEAEGPNRILGVLKRVKRDAKKE